MHAKDWGPGQVIADRYELVKQLGKGGMGAVWRAEHLGLKSPVAIKLIDPAIANSKDALQRFMREAQAAAALRSPHVVQTFDYGIFEGTPFIAMELLEGESLAQRLERVRTLSPEDTARIVTHMARAMARAHEAGIVHRDLKPDNVFLIRNEEEEIAKVLDFGIAKATSGQLGTGSQTRTGAILGTPYYMSPEQAEGNRSIDHRTDLWAMGVIACECMTGRRPFESDALGDLILQICMKPIPKPSTFAKVPPGFDGWFARVTDRDAERRFQSARELAEALRAVVGIERSSRLPSDSDLGASPMGASALVPGGATMESAGAIARTANETPGAKGTSRIVITGATLGALVLAGVVVLVVASKRTPSPEGSPAVPAAAVSAPEVHTAGATESTATPAPVPSLENTAQQAGSAEPAPPASVAAVPMSPGKPRAVGAKTAKPPPARVLSTPTPATKPEPPAPAKRQVDFGI